jgi:hypothetical protein
MSCGKSLSLVSSIHRSNAVLKTAIAISAVRLAAGSLTPRRRRVSASARGRERALRLDRRLLCGRRPGLERADPGAAGMAADASHAHRRPRRRGLLPESAHGCCLTEAPPGPSHQPRGQAPGVRRERNERPECPAACKACGALLACVAAHGQVFPDRGGTRACSGGPAIAPCLTNWFGASAPGDQGADHCVHGR